MIESINVSGLAELRNALKQLDQTSVLKAAFVDIETAVIDRSRQFAQAVSPQAAKAAESLVPRRQDGRAVIDLGNSEYPFALGAEFGSARFRQFPAWRGNGLDAGYFLYPTIRHMTEDGSFVDRIEQNLDPLFNNAFPD